MNCSTLWAESCCPLLPYISLFWGFCRNIEIDVTEYCKFTACTHHDLTDLVTETPVDFDEYRTCNCKPLVTLSVLMHGDGKNSKYIVEEL